MRYKRSNVTREKLRQSLISLLSAHPEVTQKEIAELCGVYPSAVASWVSGRTSIDVENIPLICDFFNIPIDVFFGHPDKTELSYHEQKVLEAMRSCNKQGQTFIYDQAQLALKNFREDAGQDTPVQQTRSA